MSELTNPPGIAGVPQPVPQRGGSQPNFTSRGNAFIDALPTLITDINAAMAWIKASHDAALTLSTSLGTDVQTALDDIETARVNALANLQTVLDQIEAIQVQLGDPTADINALRDSLLAEINTAKQDALNQIAIECGGGV